jgi:tape measure domain-containing protein
MADDSNLNIKITAEDLASAVINAISDGFAKADASINKIAKSTTDVKPGIDSVSSGLNTTAINAAAIITAVEAAFTAVKNGIAAIMGPVMQMDVINIQFKSISGNALLAANDLNFVMEASQKLGLSMKDSAAAFVQFAGATKGTSLEGQGAKDVFLGMSTALTAMHLPASVGTSVLQQLSQAVGKGKVEWQDWRIVAENFPQATEILSKALGKTREETMLMIHAGQIGTDEIRKFGIAMTDTFSADAVEASKSLQSQLNILGNNIFYAANSIGQQLKPALVFMIEGFNSWITNLKNSIPALAGVAAGLTTVVGLMLIQNVSSAWGAFVTVYQSLRAAIAGAAAAQTAFNIALTTSGVGAILTGIGALIAGVMVYRGLLKSTGDQVDANKQKELDAAEATRIANAEKAQALSNYVKIFGTEQNRLLQVESEAYGKSLKTLKDKYAIDQAAAGDNIEKKIELSRQYLDDVRKATDKHYVDVMGIYEKDIQAKQAATNKKFAVDKAYFDAIGDVSSSGLAVMQQQHQKEIIAVKTKYASLRAEAKGNTALLLLIDEQEAATLEALRKKHSGDAELQQISDAERELKHKRESSAAIIAEVKKQVDEHVISAEQGRDKILLIDMDLTRGLLEEARKRAELIKINDPNNAEAYKKAMDLVSSLEAQLTKELAQQYKNRESDQTLSLNKMAVASKNNADSDLLSIQVSYDRDMNSLKDLLAWKLISRDEYTKKVHALDLEAAKQKAIIAEEEAAKELSIKTQALVDAQQFRDTDVIKYQKVLADKNAAEKDYEAKHTVLNNATRDSNKATADAFVGDWSKSMTDWSAMVEADFDKFMKELRNLGSAWGSMWDATFNDATAGLKNLSDAAYNSFAAMYKLPLKTVESVDSLRDALSKAQTDVGKLYRAAEDGAFTLNSGWYEATRNLGLVAVEAKKVTVEFLNQKIAALTLADAMAIPEKVTKAFVDNAQQALANMNLLDNTTLDKLNGAIDKVKQAMLSFTARITDALKALQDEWDNMSMTKLELEEKRYNEQRTQWQKDYNAAQAQNNMDAIKALNDQLTLINKIHDAKVIDAKSTAKGFSVGGPVPGAGSGDTVPAMLTPGEFVIKKSAASHWGAAFLAMLNNPFSSGGNAIRSALGGVQFFSEGGMVGKGTYSASDGSFSIDFSSLASVLDSLKTPSIDFSAVLQSLKMLETPVIDFSSVTKALDDFQKQMVIELRSLLTVSTRLLERAMKTPGMASGGSVGGSGTGDTQLRLLDPREWVIRPEATGFWGSGVMSAMNAPWSQAGKMLADRIAGLSVPTIAVDAPRLAMASGGPVGEFRGGQGASITNVFHITTTKIDEQSFRRDVLPMMERYSKLTR